MKTSFKQVGSLPQEIHHELLIDAKSVTLNATLSPKKAHTILFEGTLKGTVALTCDYCAEDFSSEIDEEVILELTDREYTNNEEVLPAVDVIECPSGIININEIMESEVHLMTSDYHKCKNCIDLKEEN
jgi:uncharacterized metal-binding protein YceD (DUF177 family)